MDEPILNFAAFFRAKLGEISELASVVGGRIYNSKAPQNAQLPFAVFTIIPLEDNFGQARASIQTRLLCDFKIETREVTTAHGIAVSKTIEKFKTARTSHAYENFKISVWGLRPISRISSGAVSEETIYSIGKTFQATMSFVAPSVIPSNLFPFFLRSNASANFSFSSAGEIPFLARSGSENNIALVSGKIPFINRSGESQQIDPA